MKTGYENILFYLKPLDKYTKMCYIDLTLNPKEVNMKLFLMYAPILLATFGLLFFVPKRFPEQKEED